MNAKFFLDTNVFIYSFDGGARAKQERSRALIRRALDERCGVVSGQVVQEFFNVALRKFAAPMSFGEMQAYAATVFRPLCRVFTDFNLLLRALRIVHNFSLSFYDALIIAAALEAGCAVVYSEDMHHGLVVETVEVVNPFG